MHLTTQRVKFFAGGVEVEIAEQYTYLGIVFIPSGAIHKAVDILTTKCSRAWFSLSNFLYENKRMSAERFFKLLDCLVFPVGQYATELLSPLSLPMKSFQSENNLLKAWESFHLEKVNQRACRLLLSVQKKTSRLAVLGELGRYPVLIKSLIQSIMYKRSIEMNQSTSLVGKAMKEMQELNISSSWLGRVNNITQLLGIPEYPQYWSDERVREDINEKNVFFRALPE